MRVGGRIVVVAALSLLALLGVAVHRTSGPEPIEEARAFLAPYRPLGRTVSPAALGEEFVTLERRIYLREEEARMKSLLPRSHGWSFARTMGRFPYDVTATSSGLTRMDRFVLAIPGLQRLFPVRPSGIRINLSAYKRTLGDREAQAVTRSGLGWTRAEAMFLGRPSGISAPRDDSGYLELIGTPSGPGREPGE